MRKSLIYTKKSFSYMKRLLINAFILNYQFIIT
jgi:hypothetical protein